MALAACVQAQDPKCEAQPSGSPLLVKAQDVVRDLPETVAWTRSHDFPVAYLGSFPPLIRSGHCFISVAVYAVRPERLEAWHFFYVEVEGKAILIQVPVSGEVVSLEAWRSGATR